MSKFWKKTSEQIRGDNRVITREWGDIPGCTPAYDVFVSVPIEDMQRATGKRAAEFCRLMTTLKHDEFMNHPFHYTDTELSPIRNPAPPHLRSI